MAMMNRIDVICDEIIEEELYENEEISDETKLVIKNMMLRCIEETLDLLTYRITRGEA